MLGFIIYCWFTLRRWSIAEDMICAGDSGDDEADPLVVSKKPGARAGTTNITSGPQRVLMKYQNRSRTCFLLFLKEFSLIVTPCIVGMFFAFLYVPGDFQPVLSEWARVQTIYTQNKNGFAPLAEPSYEAKSYTLGGATPGFTKQASFVEFSLEVTSSPEFLTQEVVEGSSSSSSLLQFLKRRRRATGVSRPVDEKNQNHIRVDYFGTDKSEEHPYRELSDGTPIRLPDLSAEVSVLPRKADKEEEKFRVGMLVCRCWLFMSKGGAEGGFGSDQALCLRGRETWR